MVSPALLTASDSRAACCFSTAHERSATHRAAGSSGRALTRPLALQCSAFPPCSLVSGRGPLLQVQQARYQPARVRASQRLAVAATVVDSTETSSAQQPVSSPESGTANNIAPMSQTVGDLVTTVHSPEEFQAQLDDHAGQLVILMCKAKGCRPCKAFGRKYARFAQQYSDAVFLEVFGDETPDTRKMMIEMQIKATPTFRFYRKGELVSTHSGISEDKLQAGIINQLQSGEAGFGDVAPGSV